MLRRRMAEHHQTAIQQQTIGTEAKQAGNIGVQAHSRGGEWVHKSRPTAWAGRQRPCTIRLQTDISETKSTGLLAMHCREAAAVDRHLQALSRNSQLLASTIATGVDNNHAAEDGQQRDGEQAFQQRETAITRAMGHDGVSRLELHQPLPAAVNNWRRSRPVALCSSVNHTPSRLGSIAKRRLIPASRGKA